MTPRVLILISNGMYYFYNRAGWRVAEALWQLNCHVDVSTLEAYQGAHYDCVFLMNVYDLVKSISASNESFRRLKWMRKNCRRLVWWTMECVSPPWFDLFYQISRRIEIDMVLDVGFVSQRDFITKDIESLYCFLFNGLTESERAVAQAVSPDADRRPIPWTFVGHFTPTRAKLVRHLVRDLHPGGFVFLPHVGGEPYIDENQFHNVLQHTRYQVWRSHHAYFHHIEGERFRMSLLAGAVPIKIYNSGEHIPDRKLPFSFFLMEEASCGRRIRDLNFLKARHLFIEEFLSLPSLVDAFKDVYRDVFQTEISDRVNP